MLITILDDGSVWGQSAPTSNDRHELSPVERTQYASQINDLRDQMAEAVGGHMLRSVLRALVKIVNVRLPAAQKITAAELKQAIKDEL